MKLVKFLLIIRSYTCFKLKKGDQKVGNKPITEFQECVAKL